MSTNNYNALTNLHTSQNNTAHAKFQSVIVLTGHCLLTAPNNEYSSASMLLLLLAGYQLMINFDWSVG
jgi:hypothetical protein